MSYIVKDNDGNTYLAQSGHWKFDKHDAKGNGVFDGNEEWVTDKKVQVDLSGTATVSTPGAPAPSNGGFNFGNFNFGNFSLPDMSGLLSGLQSQFQNEMNSLSGALGIKI